MMLELKNTSEWLAEIHLMKSRSKRSPTVIQERVSSKFCTFNKVGLK